MELGGFLALVLGFGLLLLFAVAINNRKTPKKDRGHHKETLNKKIVQERWDEIQNTYNLGGQSHFKSAIMDADKLLDYVLKGLNIKGETMGERLKNTEKKFSNYNDYNNLWFAHKVRNNIAHEVNHEINSAEAKRAMEYFKKALQVLGVL